MKTYFCWRCNTNMPFLEEDEWREISPLLIDAIRAIKTYREHNNCDLATARLNCKPEAMRKFEQLTGVAGINFDTIYHHRLQDWGQECSNCGHLLRTPEANYCAKCSLAQPAKHS